MKNKLNWFKKVLVLFLIVPVMFMFSACGSSKSAYELAVENGFVGTLSEWLESLQGKSAYELAVENGFEGTEEEWLASLVGTDGTNGKDGDDAVSVDLYEIYNSAVENESFAGTYLEFLTAIFSETNDEETVSNVISKCVSSVFALKVGSSTNGSAVLYKYNDNGTAYVLTNYHMIASASSYTSCTLYFYFGTGEYTSTSANETYQNTMASVSATILGGTAQYDVAVLLVDSAGTETIKEYGMQEITFADHSLGETVYAVGNNANLGISVTTGIVSKEYETVTTTIGTTKVRLRVLRHNAYITNGNSGGGLFDANGKLIGLTNGGIGSDTELRNYAIPSSIVKAVAENVIDNYERKLDNAGYIFDLEDTTTTVSTSIYYDPTLCKIIISETIELTSINTGLGWELSSVYDNDNETALQDTSDFSIFASGDILTSISINGTEYEITRNYQFKEYLLTARIGDTLLITLTGTRDGVSYTYTVSLSLDRSIATEM